MIISLVRKIRDDQWDGCQGTRGQNGPWYLSDSYCRIPEDDSLFRDPQMNRFTAESFPLKRRRECSVSNIPRCELVFCLSKPHQLHFGFEPNLTPKAYGWVSCDIHPLIWLVRLLSSMVGGETPRPDLECFSEAGFAGGCVGCLERAPDISVNALVALSENSAPQILTYFDGLQHFTTIIAPQYPIEIAFWVTIFRPRCRGHVRLRAKWRPEQTSAALPWLENPSYQWTWKSTIAAACNILSCEPCFQPCHG